MLFFSQGSKDIWQQPRILQHGKINYLLVLST